MSDFLELARQLGFSQVSTLNTAALVPLSQVRDMCAADRCRSYGRSWSCPPACGSIEQAAERMAAYSGGVIVQTTGNMADDFDLDAIRETERLHKTRFLTLARQVRCLQPDCLPLTAGACTLCRKCAYPDKPCRFPGKMLSSMEAYGLLVSDVCIKSGLKYYYGPGTMTFTSCILTEKGR